MPRPSIEVLGVYRLPITKKLVKEQTDLLSPTEPNSIEREWDEVVYREQLEKTVLVEVMVNNRDERFDVGDFTQPQPDLPSSSWQAAWAEVCLSEDGETIVSERWDAPPAEGTFRVAFYIHFWREDERLMTSYGELPCPEVDSKMPTRLKKLAPYIPLD